jgi:type IV secretion system protein VirB1
MELMACPGLAVPREVMQHVVRVESSFNPYAIGVVGGRLARQPRSLPEAVATARMLERRGYNFSLGLAQVNRHNLAKQGLASYEQAFQTCPNLRAGSRILAECRGRAGGSWGRAFSCYYSGNFVTGYRHGYVQKVFASMRQSTPSAAGEALAIDVIGAATGSAARGEAGRAPPRRASGDTDRVAARVVPVVAHAVPEPPTPIRTVSGGVAPDTSVVAVLDARGGPPRLRTVGAEAPATGTAAALRPTAAAPEPVTDSAFVF